VRLDAVPRSQHLDPVPFDRDEEIFLERRPFAVRGHLASRHLRAETQRAREQIADVFAEVGVVALDHCGEIEVAVLPERDRAQ
jgi:hypothetical protein